MRAWAHDAAPLAVFRTGWSSAIVNASAQLVSLVEMLFKTVKIEYKPLDKTGLAAR